MIIVTDFCEVRLSQKTISWLNSLDPDWEEKVFKKRMSRKTRYIKHRFRELEITANTLAAIAFYSGGFIDEI